VGPLQWGWINGEYPPNDGALALDGAISVRGQFRKINTRLCHLNPPCRKLGLSEGNVVDMNPVMRALQAIAAIESETREVSAGSAATDCGRGHEGFHQTRSSARDETDNHRGMDNP